MLLASGAFDKFVYIWDVRQPGPAMTTQLQPSKRYRGAAGVFEVCWNAQGSRVGASTADGTVYVIDVKKH